MRKQSFGQRRDEDNAESATTRLLRAAYKHASITISRRLHLESGQTPGEHIAHFGQTHRAYGGHWTQIGEH
ncbi:MAG TPA: hypothetical protein VN689_00905, partial [Burkholderiales bacterium]|nr:hypothetical protein [Burkholderiales bacterium]